MRPKQAHTIKALACCIALVLGSSATAKDRGPIEASFSSAQISAVQDAIAAACFDRGWQIGERTANSIICKDSEFGAFGDPRTRLQNIARFDMIKADGMVKVRGTPILKVTNRFGSTGEQHGTLGDKMRALLAGLKPRPS